MVYGIGLGIAVLLKTENGFFIDFIGYNKITG